MHEYDQETKDYSFQQQITIAYRCCDNTRRLNKCFLTASIILGAECMFFNSFELSK